MKNGAAAAALACKSYSPDVRKQFCLLQTETNFTSS